MEKNSNNQDYLFDDEFDNFSHIPLPEVDNWTTSELLEKEFSAIGFYLTCLLYTSPSPRDGLLSRMPSSA